MAEEWAEAHEDHDVFNQGVEVRVAFEHMLHKLRYGQIGNVIGHVQGEVCVQLKNMGALVVMLGKILVSNAHAPKYQALKTFLRTPHKVKEDMLRVIGVSDPTIEQVEVLAPIENMAE